MTIAAVAERTNASRRRLWLAMLGLVVALGLVPFSYKVERRLETADHISGGQAEAVDTELSQEFQSPYAQRLVVVIKGLPDPDSAAGGEVLTAVSSALRKVPGVSGAISSLDWPDTLFTGKNGGALILVGLDAQGQDLEVLIPRLRARIDATANQLRPTYPDFALEITGEAPLNVDLRKVSADDVNRAEERVLPVTFVLLLIAFGSLAAAMLPLGGRRPSTPVTDGGEALPAP